MRRDLRAIENRPGVVARRAAGMTLVELMVALAIGSFLLIGAITVFVQSRETFRVADSVSRLQENARFVLDALEPDVRMASYFGLTTRPAKIQRRAGPDDPVPADLAVAGDCGRNWAIHLDVPIDGTNNEYRWECAAYDGRPAPGADTLIVRRVADASEPPAYVAPVPSRFDQAVRRHLTAAGVPFVVDDLAGYRVYRPTARIPPRQG